jgi:hypothetical protein
VQIARNLDEPGVCETRQEMRDHIESLIQANTELGDSPEQAILHALEQFGKVPTVQHAWNKTLSPTKSGSFRKSVGMALAINSLAAFAGVSFLPEAVRYAENLGFSSAGTIRDLGMLALPAAAGLVTGLTVKRRPWLATPFAILIMVVPMLPVDMWQTHAFGDTSMMISRLNQLAIFLSHWIPFGCAGAGIGNLLRWMLPRSSKHVLAG